MTKDEDDRARFVARGSRVIDTESEWGSFEIIQCASGDNASRAGSVAEALNAAADRLEGVEIGPMPPMEGDGKADERLMKAYQVQQTGVPDQTALVWRTDLLDHFHRFWALQGRAALAASPSPVVGDREAIGRVVPGIDVVDRARQIAQEAYDGIRPAGGKFWPELDDTTQTLAICAARDALSLSTPVVGGKHVE